MDLYLPFNSIDDDRMHTAEDVAALFASVLTDGVHPSPGTALFTQAAGGWDVSILPGRCVIRGRLGVNHTPKLLRVDAPHGVWDRIDSVVLKCDYNERMITEILKKGTAAASPVPAALQRDEDAYELCIAHIRVGASATAITQAVITDTRQDSTLCGVTQSLLTVQPESLFAQYAQIWHEWFSGRQTQTADWLAARQADIIEWFSSLQTDLSQDAAVSLGLRLTELGLQVDALTQVPMVYETARFTATLPTSGWRDGGDGRFLADVAHATIRAEGVDVDLCLSPGSIDAPLYGTGEAHNGYVTLYAYQKPENPVTLTVSVKEVRA